jgi:hypothetical protein
MKYGINWIVFAKYGVGILFFVVCMLMISVVFAPPAASSNYWKTHDEIRLCYIMVSQLEEENHKPLDLIMGKEKTAGDLNKELTLLFQNNRARFSVRDDLLKQYILNRFAIVDLWERPFQIRWRTTLSASNYGMLVKRSPANAPVIIWSLGPNGKDDKGVGDDITWNGK